VFCPTSNLFIGSGLFDYDRLAAAGVRIALATDVGGGTSYSMLRTAAEAYKVMQLQGQNLPALAAFDLMTRANAAGARARKRNRQYRARRVRRSRRARRPRDAGDGASHGSGAHLEDELFVLMTLGDDRAVRQTYIAGRPAL
jgi:guanine deaminase